MSGNQYLTSVLTSCVRRSMALACALVANLMDSWLTEMRQSPAFRRPSRWTAPPRLMDVMTTPLTPPSTTSTLMPSGSLPFLMRIVCSRAEGRGGTSGTWPIFSEPEVDEPRSLSVATGTNNGLGGSDSIESGSGDSPSNAGGSDCGRGGGTFTLN